eukprot:CAMPEP_0181314424 /NCGR_PEP_ID=MMETSP1101-20121128/14813_1 /TAXON_ID=46948 /ORGANISM="Rhodomonas abbreviata, Strain Caron Lab Isolate" /LENGTH=113 /DNA_ID=CAMNT_0023421521 /DNA_START=294 /DNA_END=633 /DNA_ORIENTATION=+
MKPPTGSGPLPSVRVSTGPEAGRVNLKPPMALTAAKDTRHGALPPEGVEESTPGLFPSLFLNIEAYTLSFAALPACALAPPAADTLMLFARLVWISPTLAPAPSSSLARFAAA